MPNKALSLKVLLCIVLFSIFINPVYLPGAQIARAEVKPCSMVRISLETDASLSGLTEDNENLPELVFPEYFEIGISGQLQQVRQINSQSINIFHSRGIKIVPVLTCSRYANSSKLLRCVDLADSIAAAVLKNGLDGINLSADDFIDNGRNMLLPFINKLRDKLGPDKIISVNIAALASGPYLDLPSLSDTGILTKLTDYVIIKPVYNHSGSYPSNSSLNNFQDRACLEKALQKAIMYVPKSKLVIGVSENTEVGLADKYGIKGVCYWNFEGFSFTTQKAVIENQTSSDGSTQIKKYDKNAYLTFDDGPDSKITPEILDVLKEYNVKATFFINGVWAEKYPALVRRIHDEGHTLGNHTYSHKTGSIYKSWSNLKAEIERTNNIIYKLTGTKCTVFRAPGGSKPNLKKEYIENIHKMGMKIYDWNCDPRDWEAGSDSQLILSAVKSTPLKKEMFIILHSRYDRSSTLKALPQIIKYLTVKQYNIIPINKVTKEYIF